MMHSVIIAAPLLIAAMVMAVRFVGCGLDTSGIPASYSGTVEATTGLQGFWLLSDPLGSTTAADSVNNAPNGTYHPGVFPGVAGLVCSNATDGSATAASFDGVQGFVGVVFDSKLNPPHFTVEALVKPSKIASSVVVSSDTGYQLALNGNGAFEASVGTGGAFGAPIVVNAGATTTNGPFYVAMTYDGTNLSLYVNPAASGGPSTLGSDMYQHGTATYTPATSGELRIGASSAPSGEFFGGTIQDVAVYSRALGFYEIVNHYATGVCGMEPYPGGPTNGGDMAVTGNLTGSGTLSCERPTVVSRDACDSVATTAAAGRQPHLRHPVLVHLHRPFPTGSRGRRRLRPSRERWPSRFVECGDALSRLRRNPVGACQTPCDDTIYRDRGRRGRSGGDQHARARRRWPHHGHRGWDIATDGRRRCGRR